MARRDDDSGGVSYSWCPVCKCWVPAHKLQHDIDEETGRILRICDYCMGEPIPEGRTFVHDPYHESTQCIYCDSYNTQEQAPRWRHFKCLDCGEEFTI